MKTILLDLNHTLVKNSEVKITPFTKQIENETYRMDLVNVLKKYVVILITARPIKHKAQTLISIREKTRWLPRASYFNDLYLRPPQFKERVLLDHLLKFYDPNVLFAVESNPQTRAMYARHNIKAVTWEEFLHGNR